MVDQLQPLWDEVEEMKRDHTGENAEMLPLTQWPSFGLWSTNILGVDIASGAITLRVALRLYVELENPRCTTRVLHRSVSPATQHARRINFLKRGVQILKTHIPFLTLVKFPALHLAAQVKAKDGLL